MRKFISEVELIDAILEKFQVAKGLSKGDSAYMAPGSCFYSHDFNGIGCVFGCLLSRDVASWLDEAYAGTIKAIMQILRDGDLPDWVATELYQFALIGDDVLLEIQQCHDQSQTVAEALDKLKTLLAAQ